MVPELFSVVRFGVEDPRQSFSKHENLGMLGKLEMKNIYLELQITDSRANAMAKIS